MKHLDIKKQKKYKSVSVEPQTTEESSPAAEQLAQQAEEQMEFEQQPKRNRVFLKLAVFLAASALASSVYAGYYILPEATVDVVTRTEVMSRNFEIMVDAKSQTVSAERLSVPGQIVQQSIQGKNVFSATGSKNVGEKASGFVWIHNFSKNTLILKKDTTVLTANGREYFFLQDVSNIRPTAMIGLEEQEIDPTSLIAPVPVVAAGPGSQYDLPVGARLEITNEAFGQNSELLYAVVAEDRISGGTNETVPVVTQNDINSAFSELSDQLVEKAENELRQREDGLRLVADATSKTIQHNASSVAAGAEVGKFEAEQSLSIRGLVYDQKDVLALVRDRTMRLLPENRELDREDEAVRTKFLSVDLEKGQGMLSAHYEGKVNYGINRDEFVSKIKGRSPEEIKDILLSSPEIETAEITLKPFWVKKAPKNSEKIRIITP